MEISQENLCVDIWAEIVEAMFTSGASTYRAVTKISSC